MTDAPGLAETRRKRKRAGFALLAVIWGVGVISLLVLSFMKTGRLRLQTAHNIASATQANYIADGVINLAMLTLVAEKNANVAPPRNAPAYAGAPHYCVYEGAAIAVAIEDEAGKVDLNAASPELLEMTLAGLGVEARAAKSLAQAIVAFRTPAALLGKQDRPPPSDKPFAPKQAPFETVLELDQVDGVNPALFRDLTPFVTTHSRNAGVDARASPPALFAALAGFRLADVQALRAVPYPNALDRDDRRFPAQFNQQGGQSAFLIHVEALLATGQTAAKDAILDLSPTSGKPFAIKEMRRGQSKYVDRLREMIATNGAGVPAC
ncbi:type II secretion system protein GspK [Methylocystis sp. 9N]|uniref:Type II secretion system protein GspK n=1 Tax=Methylocystis borbori TaxID=3118750 RepID=A0ABU7XHV3_9HYPH